MPSSPATATSSVHGIVPLCVAVLATWLNGVPKSTAACAAWADARSVYSAALKQTVSNCAWCFS